MSMQHHQETIFDEVYFSTNLQATVLYLFTRDNFMGISITSLISYFGCLQISLLVSSEFKQTD